jgi:acyl-coenzyme A thioesterase PaaI-like protein
VLRAGARTVFCEGDVLDSAGRAVCTARAVFKLIAL